MYCNILSDSIPTELFTASLIGYLLLMHVKEFGQLLKEISSLLEIISRGLYYERMKLSYLCTKEYLSTCINVLNLCLLARLYEITESYCCHFAVAVGVGVTPLRFYVKFFML